MYIISYIVSECTDESGANGKCLTCCSGFKYKHDGQLYNRYSTEKHVNYLKFVNDSCPSRATIKNTIL